MYSFESVPHPGMHIGIQNNGHPMPPHQVGMGVEGSFTVVVNQGVGGKGGGKGKGKGGGKKR